MNATFAFRRHATATLATVATVGVAALLAATSPARAQEADPHVSAPVPAGALTREQVRAELAEARRAGTLATPGEAGDSETVLAARAVFNERQAVALLERQREEQAHAQALREAEIALAAATADYIALQRMGLLQRDEEDVGLEVELLAPAEDAEPADEQVVISLAGGSPAQRQRRAQAILQQLVSIGLRREQVYVEEMQG